MKISNELYDGPEPTRLQIDAENDADMELVDAIEQLVRNGNPGFMQEYLRQHHSNGKRLFSIISIQYKIVMTFPGELTDARDVCNKMNGTLQPQDGKYSVVEIIPYKED